MSKELYIGVGDEVINDFIHDSLVATNENMEAFSVTAHQRTLELFITGSFKQLKGTVKFQMFLENFSQDLNSPETIVFTVKPIGTLSKMAFPSIKLFKDRFEPFFIFQKDILIVNLHALIKEKKPEFLSLLNRYQLKQLTIETGMIMVNLIKNQ
ncbi:MAG TPA: hypothetical protein PLN92_01390 [Thermotogota bacterium]|nr:hypothetical protein [Thermotogota bacterium]